MDSSVLVTDAQSRAGPVAPSAPCRLQASEGTIFLDEIGELPLATQVRLLRVLETGEFIKVGSSKVLKTNVFCFHYNLVSTFQNPCIIFGTNL